MCAEPSPGSGPVKVLVVDDEEDIVEYLKTVLEDNGFVAEGALRADEALAKVSGWGPDLVLLDILMPRHSGLSLYEEIRRDPATSRLPILIVSGYAKPEEFQKMESGLLGEAGVPAPDGYLEKPISVPVLLDAIRGLGRGKPGGGP